LLYFVRMIRISAANVFLTGTSYGESHRWCNS